jgi:integrase
MIRQGIPIPTVSKILGHANPAITMTVYAHVLEDMEKAASDLIDAMYQAECDQIVTTAD